MLFDIPTILKTR